MNNTARRVGPSGPWRHIMGIGCIAALSGCAVPEAPEPQVPEPPVPAPEPHVVEPPAPEPAPAPRVMDEAPVIRAFEPWELDESRVQYTLRVGHDAAQYDFTAIQPALEAATTLGEADEGVRIVIAPGVYRETLDLTDWRRSAPLIIEGAPGQATVVSGSDIFSDWTRHPAHPEIWQHDWPYTMGPEANPWPGLMPMKPGESFRREMLFVDKQPYRQVFAMDALEPGTYLVDEDQAKVFLYPQAGSRRGKVEISVRPEPRFREHSKLLRVVNAKNIVLRQLVFEHAATPPFNAGAVQFLGGERIWIEDCVFRWNNGVGLAFMSFQHRLASNVVVRRVQANHNGTTGLGGGFHNGLIEDTETNHNNWRGAERGATGWAPCGFKLSGVDQVLLRRVTAAYNHASGGWFDDHITHVVIEDFRGINNYRSGLSLEAVDGPVLVTGAVLMGNSTGLNAFDSEHIYVQDSFIVNNARRGIRIAGSSPLSEEELLGFAEGWRRERLSKRRTPRHYHIANTIIAHLESDDAQLIGFGMREDAYRTPDGDYALQATLDTLQLKDNHYYLPEPARSGAFSDLRGQPVSFERWQELTGQDRDVHWNRSLAEQRLEQYIPATGYKPTGFGVQEAVTGTDAVDELEL